MASTAENLSLSEARARPTKPALAPPPGNRLRDRRGGRSQPRRRRESASLVERKYGKAAEQVRRKRGGETPEEELKRLRRENA